MTAKEHALLDLLERTVPYLEQLAAALDIKDLETLIDTIRATTVLAVMEE